MSDELNQDLQSDNIDEAQTIEQSNLEAEAKRFGWVPLDEFRGNEDSWVDAETFVKRGKELNPILRENNKRLLGQITALEARLEEQSLTIKEFGDMYKKMTAKAYEKAMRDVKEQMRQAQREGDYDLADQLETQFDSLKAESEDIVVPEVKQAQGQQAKVQQLLVDWQSENTWYQKDEELTALADGMAVQIAKSQPHLVGKRELLDLLTERVKKAMPEKFKNTRRESGSPVAGGGQTRAASKSGSKGYNDLPPDAKQTCDRFVKEGLFKDRAAYAKAYFDD